ncbi:hypothetical protein OSB04_005300 [Centaurea solstitialis]|uniref:Uncharacterized protein n=1 Tax=Centaurea solstitialis TaxID=347529 RepID=A0AA38TSD9_9ASTR|nr:hypothetical protein OSB04_005300 [Centaurea solstitialis]
MDEMHLFFISLISLFSLIFLSKLLTPKKARNLAPSPPSLPIIGHLHLIGQPFHRALQQLSSKYGPVMSLRFGSRQILVVSSPSAVEECFTKKDIVLANRPLLLSMKYINYGQNTVGTAPYGRLWRDLRRIATLELFSAARLKSYMGVRHDEVRSARFMPKYQPESAKMADKTEKESQVTLHYPMLSRNNYAAWAIKMKVFMQAQGVWDAVEPKNQREVVEVKKDKMALAAIYQGIPEDLLLSLAEKQTAKEAWGTLKTMYMGADRVKTAKVQTLKAEFETLSMKDTEVIDDFAVKVNNIVSNIRALGEKVDEAYVVKKLLRAVPSKFLQIASTIEQFADLDRMTVEEVIGRLKAHEERVRGQSDSGEGKLLLSYQEWLEKAKKKGDEEKKPVQRNYRSVASSSRGRGRGRGRGGFNSSRGGRRGGGFYQSRDGGRGSSSTRDKNKIQCYNCQEFGHFAYECRNPRKERIQEANLTQEDDEPALLLAASNTVHEVIEEVYLNEKHVTPTLRSSNEGSNTTKIWFLDNGASNHMTGDKEKFSELNESVRGYVRFGDDSRVRIEGKGSIFFICKNGEKRMLRDVYYIPSLCNNIISLGQLAQDGDRILMHGLFLWIHDKKGRLLMKVKQSKNRLYKIVLSHEEPHCFLSRKEESSWLWHSRLGHVNFQMLKQMRDKDMVYGLDKIEQPSTLCKSCLEGKQTRNSFPAQAIYKAKTRLELIHADLCGPITPPTASGNRYFLLLVDDFSRVMWIYLLKSKDEALSSFQKFRLLIENVTDEKVKTLRSDRGGEFLSKSFTMYCDETGLNHQFSAPYSPQQNGVVERRNRMVIEMARSMMKYMKVPEVLWGEAVRQAVYILNRVSTKALNDKTPYEAWSGKRPNIGRLRVFGCVAHSKVLRGQQRKLDSRSEMLVHLGTETGSKAYRLLDPVSGRIRVSRDVRFEEYKAWPWDDTIKFKGKVGATFIVEGYKQENPDVEAESGESVEPFTDPETPQSQPLGESQLNADQNESVPIESPVASVGSSSTASSSTGGGAPKRYRSLAEIYEETDQIELEPEQLMFMQDVDEPTTYSVAAKDREWVKAMKSELDAIERNKTWSLVDLPAGRKPIGLKWLFKLKRDPNGKIIKYKARLVAKGYVQKPGVDFDEVFAPVARLETIRILLALASSRGWKVHHLDVKSAFLNGNLEEEVYVTQPEGYVKANHPEQVYKLSKALYGLRQAPRAWNSRLDKCLKGLKFERCGLEHAVYTRKEGGNLLIVGVYVDDLVVTGNCDEDVKYFKEQMSREFEMSDLGLLSYYLGIEVSQHEDGISLKQTAYAKNVLLKAGMEDCNPSQFPMEHKEELTKDEEGVLVDPTQYRSIIGGLRYLTHTRPDISYAVGIVSRFMERPTLKHMQAVKRILRYVRGTVDYGLIYVQEHKGDAIIGFSDSNHARDAEDRRSTGGMAFYLNENLITWGSKKQQCVALSSCEAEFMAATTATCQGIWVSRLVHEITGKKVGPFMLYLDNKSTVDLIKNPVFHGRSKHIDLKYHFIRECVERGDVIVKRVCSKEQRADIFTKPLPRLQFIEMRRMLGVKNLIDSGLRGKLLA